MKSIILQPRDQRRLKALLANIHPLQYSDHQVGRGPAFYAAACDIGRPAVLFEREREFESGFLQWGVECEPDLGNPTATR